MAVSFGYCQSRQVECLIMVLRLINLLKYYLFWIVFFIVCRLFFELYNIGQTAELSISTVLLTFWHGLRLDVSIAGFLAMFVALALAFSYKLESSKTATIIGSVSVFFIVIFSIIGICDCELYRNWGFRMDSTVLMYLKTPKEAVASTPLWLTLIFVVWMAMFIWLTIKAYIRIVGKSLRQMEPTSWKTLPVLLFVACVIIIPVRGGFGIASNKAGSVYFSNQQFANHSAVNAQWNFCNSLRYLKRMQTVNFMPQAVADSIVADMLKADSASTRLLKTDRPDILIMIMESFTAKAVGCVGGMQGVTPNLDRLSHKGILFSNCYASGDRSDKGIVSILSGYPAQPTTSIIKFTAKASKLPHLSQKLHAEGYNSSFYYGGDIEFANMKSYFITGDYGRLVTMNEFDKSDMNSKWGAHDHVVLDRWHSDINQFSEPFFSTLFTLSSHEPFEVPHTSQFTGTDEESLFLNSVHYTDSCIGDFVGKASAEPWWNNTLLILVADHGSRHPGDSPVDVPEKFHIPMIWLGGALNVIDTVIDKYLSQNDIPALVCNQLGIESDDFTFSKDVLAGSQPFAFYSYNNGIGYVVEDEQLTWDNVSSRMTSYSPTDSIIKQSHAFLQTLLNERFYFPRNWFAGTLNVADTVIDKYLKRNIMPTFVFEKSDCDSSKVLFGKNVFSGVRTLRPNYCNNVLYYDENEQLSWEDLPLVTISYSPSDTTVRQSHAFLQTLLNDFNLK